MNAAKYVRCDVTEIPRAVRFDVLPQDAGQMVEVAWGTISKYEAAPGDPWKRVHNRSLGPAAIEYFRRVEVQS